MELFLSRIWSGYASFNVSYHNDIHGLDVAQMTYVILEAGLRVKAALSPLDCIAVIVAGVCHDFRHDGFTNPWHIQKKSIRFLEHGEVGTQEKFHFAESWDVLCKTKLLDNLDPDQGNLFKRRM